MTDGDTEQQQLTVGKQPDAFVDELAPFRGATALYIDVALFIAVVLVAIRFFWITRNITSYLRRNRDAMDDPVKRVKVARSVILIHFPVIILHALMLYA